MPTWGSVMGMGLAGYGAMKAHETGVDEVIFKNMGIEIPSNISVNGKPIFPINIDTRGAVNDGGNLAGLHKEISELHRTIEDLSRNRYQQGPMVIHTGQSTKGWMSYVIPITVAGGVFYLYVRLRGGSIMDFMFVTRNSLQSFRSAVTDSFGRLWEELRRQKDELAARLAGVSAQQEELLKHQEEMLGKQGNMDKKLEGIQDVTTGIESKVDDMGSNMALMQRGVERANQGIYMLCAAVAEVTRHVGISSNQGASGLLNNFVEQTSIEATATAGFNSTALPAGRSSAPLLTSGASSSASGDIPTSAARAAAGLRGLLVEGSESFSPTSSTTITTAASSPVPLMSEVVSLDTNDAFLAASRRNNANAPVNAQQQREMTRSSSIWNYIGKR